MKRKVKKQWRTDKGFNNIQNVSFPKNNGRVGDWEWVDCIFPSPGVNPKRDLNFCKTQIIFSENREELTVWPAVLLYHVPAYCHRATFQTFFSLVFSTLFDVYTHGHSCFSQVQLVSLCFGSLTTSYDLFLAIPFDCYISFILPSHSFISRNVNLVSFLGIGYVLLFDATEIIPRLSLHSCVLWLWRRAVLEVLDGLSQN